MMSTARLRELYKQEQNHRKFACVRNDMVKTQQQLYEGFIDKEKQESVQKNQKAIVFTRKNVVRQHVLERCMKNTREKMGGKREPAPYGRYNGVPMEEIAGGIDSYIERNHPRIRRKQKIEELFNRGYRKGAILDPTTVHDKVEKYFERPLVEVRVDSQSEEKETETQFLPSLDSKVFYTRKLKPSKFDQSQRHTHDCNEDDNLFVRNKVKKYLTEDIPDNVSINSDVISVPMMASTSKVVRPITLPPIKIGTDNSQLDGKPSTDCISDIITRINHAKERREREAKFKKEKRERRILAEKVHGVAHGDLNEMENDLLKTTVPSRKGSEFLNLTTPVFSKTRPTQKHAHSRARDDSKFKNVHANNDARQTGSDVNIKDKASQTMGRFVLPPMKLKRNSASDKS